MILSTSVNAGNSVCHVPSPTLTLTRAIWDCIPCKDLVLWGCLVFSDMSTSEQSCNCDRYSSFLPTLLLCFLLFIFKEHTYTCGVEIWMQAAGVIILVYVQVPVYVCIFVCVCLCVCTRTLEDIVAWLSFLGSHSPGCFLKQCLLLFFACFHLTRSGKYTAPCLAFWFWRIKLRSSCLQGQHFTK